MPRDIRQASAPGAELESIRSVQVTSGSFLQLNRATGWLVILCN